MKPYTLLLILCIAFRIGHSQERISGRVTASADSSPIPGVSITLANGLATTTTDNQGQFSILLQHLPDTLVISHMGYQTVRQAVRPAATPIQVTLVASDHVLEEVIVNTGYQSIPTERATGSFVSISGDKLREQVQTNVLTGLPLLTSGMSTGRLNDRGALPQLRVRGMSTLNGPEDPLIILDNFPFEGDVGNINPHDVESITVLKDAAAASIWGARAGNGVIVITTKKASYGQRLQVDVTSNLKVTPKPDLFYQPRLSSAEIIDVERFLFGRQHRFADTLHYEKAPFSAAYELLFQHRAGKLSEGELESQLDRLGDIDVRRGYTDLFYRPGINQQHALSMRSGTDKHAWNLSVGYDRNRSTLDASYERLSLRYGNASRLTDRLTLTTGINFAWNADQSGKPAYGSFNQSFVGLPPYTAFLAEDGSPLPFYRQYRQSFVDEMADHGSLQDWNYYPTEDYRHDRVAGSMLHGVVDAGLNYRLLPGLDAEVKYQFHLQQVDTRWTQDPGSYAVRNLINRSYQPGSDSFVIPEGGILDHTAARINTRNYRSQLNLNRTWGSHAFAAIGGGEVREVNRSSVINRFYGFNEETLLTTPVNYSDMYTDFLTGWPLTVQRGELLSAGTNRYLSVYVNGSYTYLSRYTASFSARRDASNIFGAETNNRWTPLWSAGLAWNINDEPFYAANWLPYLKVRATYGYSGNIDPSLSAITTIAYSGTSIHTRSGMAAVDRYYNPNLRWEKIGQVNLALDFRLANDRISGSVEYYMKNGVDLYGPSPVDYTAGINAATVTRNTANMRGNGIDVQLNTVSALGELSWRTTLNTSYYTDKVTRYYLRDRALSNYVSGSGSVFGMEGMPVQPMFSFRSAGLDPLHGDPQGFGPDGEISQDYNYLTNTGPWESLRLHGSTAPKYFGAIGNTLQWRELSLSVYIGYRLGHYFRRTSISYPALYGQLVGHADYRLRWMKPGDEQSTSVPSMPYPLNNARETFYSGSDVLVERADNIRLQYMNLSYRFRKLQIYINCNNMGLLWAANSSGIDPDYNTNDTPLGMDVAIGFRYSL